MKQPDKSHPYALVRDPFGNAGVVIKIGGHIDYIYGMFKGRETTRRDDEFFESWHKEGEQVPLLGHPTKGDVVLVMGYPGPGDVQELSGPEAKAIIESMKESHDPATP